MDELEYLSVYRNEMEAYMNSKCSRLNKKIDNDFKEILGTVTAYCETMKKSLQEQVKNFQKQKEKQLTEISNQIDKYWQTNEKERHKIFYEFVQILEENFDYKNEFCVNSFIKRLKTKEGTFTCENYCKR